MQNEVMRRIAALLKSKERVGAYLRRWLGWAGVGGMLMVSMSCSRWGMESLIRNWCDVNAKRYVLLVGTSDNHCGFRNVFHNVNGKRQTILGHHIWLSCDFDELEDLRMYVGEMCTSKQSLSETVPCGGTTADGKYKCICYGDNNCKVYSSYLSFDKYVDLKCNGKNSCLIIKGPKDDEWYVYYKNNIVDYLNIIYDRKNEEMEKPDEILYK